MSAVTLRDVVVEYPVHGAPGTKPQLRRALDGISLQVRSGESFGLVGESGCGKSTTANVMLGLAPLAAGEMLFDDVPAPARRPPALRRHIQMVFQDPASSLNPRRRVRSMLSELITHHRLATSSSMDARLRELMEMVGLPDSVLSALPGNLSGGQRQRVAIARALAVEPKILVADEAVSALDVSAQAKVINLLADLRDDLGLTLVFISHDLAVVRALCDRAAVMNAGQVVEVADTEALFTDPQEPYTRQLLAAIPGFDPAG
ncbi:ATP-binding cassette domain-containing protein [Microbacterium sp. EST19A]|uniref:ATP-binding cassette domain-containing protein n=1 Tax=Microbacterium sp. EST19A TaxID=2862681 RepID=UPI001CC16C7E|nr:ATP-binding cassette domain-containing protein [Microbacterium sp. EST19A]